MQLIVDPRGLVRCVYGEAIDLAELGPLVIARGSHVDPDENGQWLVDLTPVGGPMLGPFARRSEALAVEVQWLQQHWLTVHT